MESNDQQNAYAAPSAELGGTTPITGTGWVKLWGILTLLGGAMLCLSIILLPLGIPYIIAGIAVMRGADETNSFSRSRDPVAADRALREYIRHFRILGIVTIVIVGLYALILVGAFAAAMIGASDRIDSVE